MEMPQLVPFRGDRQMFRDILAGQAAILAGQAAVQAKLDNLPIRLENSPLHSLLRLGVEDPGGAQALGAMPNYTVPHGQDGEVYEGMLLIFPSTRCAPLLISQRALSSRELTVHIK